jgi:hypothetical protein
LAFQIEIFVYYNIIKHLFIMYNKIQKKKKKNNNK